MSVFEDYAKTLNPDPLVSKIFLEVKPEGETLEKALDILKSTGVEIVRYCEAQERPSWITICISSEDIKEGVLRLSEAGFRKVRGINRQSGKQL